MSRFPSPDVTFRGAGPSVQAAGDGLVGAYSAVVHDAPSGGLCKVVIPALNTLQYFTALCSPAFTANAGDSVLVMFDERKQPWVLSPTGVVTTGSDDDTLGGDLSGALSSAEVNTVLSGQTPVVTTDSRLTNARTPTGSAGGDLSGSYPTPTVSKVLGVAVPLTAASWITVTSFLNSWSAVTTVAYFKDPLGFVHFKGRITGGASDTTAFQVPAGYRIGQADYFPVGAAWVTTTSPNSAVIVPDTAGNITVLSTNTGDVSVAALTYLATN